MYHGVCETFDRLNPYLLDKSINQPGFGNKNSFKKKTRMVICWPSMGCVRIPIPAFKFMAVTTLNRSEEKARRALFHTQEVKMNLSGGEAFFTHLYTQGLTRSYPA